MIVLNAYEFLTNLNFCYCWVFYCKLLVLELKALSLRGRFFTVNTKLKLPNQLEIFLNLLEFLQASKIFLQNCELLHIYKN